MSDLLQISIWFYSIVALSGATLLLYVLYLAMDDLHLNRHDRPKVIKERKKAFFADAIFLGLTVGFRDYWIVAPIVGFVASGFVVGGAWILIVNAVSLRDRAPRPPAQSGYGAPVAHSWWRKTIL